MSPALSFTGYCDALVRETASLRSRVRDADLALPVPTCPGWNLGHLLRHVGCAYRWADEAVRTRAAAPVADDLSNDVTGYGDTDSGALGEWLVESAERLAATLCEAGPDATVWAPAPPYTSLFWARRMAAEAVVHRYDATRAVGAPYHLEPQVAVTVLEEWLENCALPQAFASEGRLGELLGEGRTVHLHATDVAAKGAGEWLVDLTGERPVVRRAHEKAAVAVRGPVTELLLLMYGRRSPDAAGVELFGAAELFTRWRYEATDWMRQA